MKSEELYRKYRRSQIWTIIFATVTLICLLLALFVFVGTALSEECDTMLCGWCKEYPETCTLYPEEHTEFLPVIANAFDANAPTPRPTPTLAPTMTP